MSPPSSALYDSWGHSLPTIDPSKVFRVFLQNTNGLNLSGATYLLQHDLRLSHDYGVASLCLPETNLNWDLPHLKSTFSLLLRNTWRNSTFSVSKSPEEFVSNHQPGGTGTLICDNWTSRVVDRGEDPLGFGRWSYVTHRGKGLTKLLWSRLITPHSPLAILPIFNNRYGFFLNNIDSTVNEYLHSPAASSSWIYKAG